MKFNTEDLLSSIEREFKNVRLDGGVSLAEARAIDEDTEYLVSEESQKSDLAALSDDWRKVTSDTLEAYPYLAHLDAIGFRYYLPAAMHSFIRVPNPRSNSFYQLLILLNPLDHEDRKERYVLLSSSQRKVVAEFLLALLEMSNIRAEYKDDIRAMLDSYWGRP